MNIEDNRKSFRIKCKEPICTRISIVKVNNKTVKTGTGNICLEDIGSGGLKFLSGLNMPVSDFMIIEFKLVIEEELTAFYGYIVRKVELVEGIFRYGVKFINDVAENEQPLRKIYESNKSGNLNKASPYYKNVRQYLKRYKSNKNERLYKRYKFSDKPPIKMNLGKSNGKTINSEWEDILINNISLEGIEFTSDFKLPEIDNKMLEFRMIISGREVFLKCNIISREKLDDGKYRYIIKFQIPDSEKKIISEALKNKLNICIRNSIYKRKCFTGKYNQYQVENKNFEWWV